MDAFVERFRVPATRVGSLSGLRFAVKDLIDVAGYTTGAGNPTWAATHPPAPVNAPVVDQLLASGAACAGKVVTDELAYSLTGENSFFGTPLNPRAPDRVPGGSSSGSASSVAQGIVDFALGTDTGGSVRVPAANCGIYGWRPTHGRVSVAGVMPFAPTFDTVGLLAGDPFVLAQAAAVLLGDDVAPGGQPDTMYLLIDAFDLADDSVRTALERPLAGLRSRYGDRFRETSMREIGGTSLDAWYDTYMTLQTAEIWSTLGPWVESTRPELGSKTRASLERAKTFDRTQIEPATRERTWLSRRLHGCLGPRDLLCLPTAPSIAPLKGPIEDGHAMRSYLRRTLTLTAIAGVARLPQVSLPLADVDGVPAGLSLIGRQHADTFLLSVTASP